MKQNNKAFSLIELSIVLIIIGLLVAGITGGKSLIESAKIHRFHMELQGYRQAVYTFKVAKNRLPGDLDNDNRIGLHSTGIDRGQVYNTNSFPAPYNSNDNGYGIPNFITAPFVDLYLEGVIDFQPKNTNLPYGGSSFGTNLAKNGAIPLSNAIKNVYYFFEMPGIGSLIKNERNGLYMTVLIFEHGKKANIPSKFFYNFDKKYDDGIFNKGDFRGNCGLKEYERAIKDKNKCTIAYYKVLKNNNI